MNNSQPKPPVTTGNNISEVMCGSDPSEEVDDDDDDDDNDNYYYE